MDARKKTLKVHQLLNEHYGLLKWEPRREPMHELISTMLSHRTTQVNEDKAFTQMWERFGSWKAIMEAELDPLIETLAPAQFAAAKAMNIQKTLRIIKVENGKFTIDHLKDMSAEEGLAWLLKLPGVGVKTATLVLLFCFAKPVLPVDTHVYRISQRVGFIGPKVNVEKAHKELLDMLPKDHEVLYNFHIHMLWHGQKVCKWSAPRHEECPLRKICNYFKAEELELGKRKSA